MSGASPDRLTDATAARALLAEVDARPTVAAILAAHRRLGDGREALAAVPLRLACAASFTFDPLRPALELQSLRAGLAADVHITPFGQALQELIDPASGLHAFRPDAVLLALRLPDLCPAVYEAYNGLAAGAADAIIDDCLNNVQSALRGFRRRCAAHLLIQNFEQPATPALGIADSSMPHSQTAAVARANEVLRRIAGSIDNAHVMDYDGLIARHGRQVWTDPRMMLVARIPVAPAHYWTLAGFYVRHLRPLFGLTKKVLVVDADNTLWGGEVGDAGMNGITLGPDYPGNAFIAFQKRLLDLHHRGVILAMASKNEAAAVQEVLDKHPDMVLRTEHFAALRVNWEPKPGNVERIAADLNLGLDSFLFMDDSPTECALMRAALPQVLTVQLPADPASLAGAVDSLDCFDQWTISDEDRQRGRLYHAEAGRRTLQESAVDMPTFYRQLAMRMTIRVDDPTQAPRVAQLTNRTNQFNMNTVRCSEDDIRRYMKSDEYRVVSVALADRFGDNGVVGAAVVKCGAEDWTLRQLLLSCRILGRTVEQSFVAWIAGLARAAGARRLVGLYAPAAKNRPFAGFYASCGFSDAGTENGVQRWSLLLGDAEPAVPDWMDIGVMPSAKGSE